MARVALIEARPWDPATGAVVPVRLAGGGRRHYTHKGSTDWLGGVMTQPSITVSLPFDDAGFSAGGVPQAAAIGFMSARGDALASLARLSWLGAAIVVSSGDDEAAALIWTVDASGAVAAIAIQGGQLTLTMSDAAAALSKPIAPGAFTGAGGLEGPAEEAGRAKRRSWGRCWNVEARLVIAASNVYELGDPAHALLAIDVVRDKGRAGGLVVVGWQGSAAATLAALIATAPPAGGAAVAPSIACVRWWTVPSGPLTADIRGQGAGGYVETVPAIAAQIAGEMGVATTGLAAVIAARPDPAGVHVDGSTEAAGDVLNRLLIPASVAWTIGAGGQLQLLPITLSDPVATVRASAIEREAAFAPVTSVVVGYRHNHRVHGDGEISAAVLADDVMLTDGTSLAGELDALDAAIDALSSDSILAHGAEKQETVTRKAALDSDMAALVDRYAALGAPADIALSAEAAAAKVDALSAYLSALVPSWSDAGVDTPIDRATWNARWREAYAAIATFRAAITGRKGDAAPLISLSPTSLSAKYDGADVLLAGQSVTWAASRVNTTLATVWTVYDAAGTLAAEGPASLFVSGAPTAWSSSDPDHLTLSEVGIASLIVAFGGSLSVQARLDGTTIKDRKSLTKVKDGSTGEDGSPGQDAVVLEISTSAIDISATYAGATKAGQLPKTAKVTVRRGTADVTGTAVLSVGPTDGIHVASLDDSGNFVIDQADSAGYVTCSASLAGVTLGEKRIQITRTLDNPPPASQSSGSDVFNGSITDRSFQSYGSTTTLKANGNGQLSASISAEYYVDAVGGGNRSFTAAAAIGWRPAGSSAWSYSEAATGNVSQVVGGGEPSPGTVNLSTTLSGLSASAVYEVVAMLRYASGANGNTASVSGQYAVSQ